MACPRLHYFHPRLSLSLSLIRQTLISADTLTAPRSFLSVPLGPISRPSTTQEARESRTAQGSDIRCACSHPSQSTHHFTSSGREHTRTHTMTISTLAVGAATTPTVIGTFLSHYLSRRKWRKKKATKEEDGDPTAEITYDEGIKVIRSFLAFAAKHTLEETQQFTATHVPAPSWVKRTVVTVPQDGCIDKAEELLQRQLESYGPVSMERIGGKHWWKVRGRELQGEWIEMKKDYVKRTTAPAPAQAQGGTPEEKDERVMLYIHGGAYFFSSLDTHRYQIQRHARKLGGRAFAPAYRLAPQYPFPCALLDALASYLFLISPPPDAAHAPIHPRNIILAGDSAGGGCVISLLVCIRDLGLPMPAGADLFSPWVDLCHSFPSILTNAETDYIPGNGFHFKPS